MNKKQTSHDKRILANLPDVMEVEQMCEFLGISMKTGYSLLREGVIAHIKIGRFYRIPQGASHHLFKFMS